MNKHNRNITLGDRNPHQQEHKFIHYGSGKVVVNIGKFKGVEIKEVPSNMLKFYLTFEDLEERSRKAINEVLSPNKKKPKKKNAKYWKKVNKRRRS